MNASLWFAIILGTALIAVLATLLKRTASAPLPLPANPRTLDFAPMTRLLDESDFDFLSSQPGFTPQIAQQLRQRRVRVFRSYLDALALEFHNLHRQLRLAAVYSSSNPDLPRLLVQAQARFTRNLFLVRLQLAFFAFGIRPTGVSDLVATVDTLRTELQQIAAALATPAPVAA